jgi:hypothetical protein
MSRIIDASVHVFFKDNDDMRAHMREPYKSRGIPDYEKDWYGAPGGENAGQCGSCFNGTAAMAGVATALARGEAGPAEVARLAHWCGFLPGRGACATLDGAANVAASLLREFPAEVDAHQRDACPACAATDFLATGSPFALTPDSITPPVRAAL